jgi:diacylglycerol kinase family enzyme
LSDALPVIVNAGGGTAKRAGDKLEAQLKEAFGKAGIAIDLMLVPGDKIAATLEDTLKTSKRVAIGGGDGTLGSCSLAIAKAGATLGVLPLGTRNHLARQLGVGPELEKAVEAIAHGRTQDIDLGRIGERGFVNNVSIGLYPELVRLRDDAPLPKAIANIPAAWVSLKRLRHHRLRVTIDGSPETVRTPILFVGNNLYSLERGSLGQRDSLQGGKLGIYAVAATSRLGLVRFIASALRGRIDYDRDFAQLTACRQLKIDAHAGSLDVAIDGEVVRLRTPISIEMRPLALKVFAA